ncbi:MAG TPA: hypothetical protein VGM29_15060 [Polyangiaceae bacterium]|jgi:hypothetical protein
MPAPSLPSAPADISQDELVQHLAGAVGEAKAREVIHGAVSELGFNGTRFTRAQALDVLERVALSPGIIGITARFVKSRLLLRPTTAA